AIDVHSKDLRVHANVPLPAQALPAMAADDVRLAGHKLAHLPVLDALADLDDRSAELMADNARRLDPGGRPRVPIVNVKVGAAHGGSLQANLDVPCFDRGLVDLDDLDPRGRANLGNGFHGSS